MPHTYLAYGLGIHSEIELPELVPTHAESDITIRYQRIDFSDIEPIESNAWYIEDDQARLQYEGVGSFQTSAGREIWIDPAPNTSALELRLMLLGPVFSFLLHQRGLLVLHASVVAKKNRARAFLANSGEGKSTTAAAMLPRGFALVVDDLLAVAPDPGRAPMIFPAYPFLKISPDAARALGRDLRAAPRVSAQINKHVLQIPDIQSMPVELARIYLIERGEQPRIVPLEPPENFIALVRYTFVAQLLQVTNTEQKHFRQCEILAKQIPICKLQIPESLDMLAHVAGMVDEDFHSTTEQGIHAHRHRA